MAEKRTFKWTDQKGGVKFIHWDCGCGCYALGDFFANVSFVSDNGQNFSDVTFKSDDGQIFQNLEVII